MSPVAPARVRLERLRDDEFLPVAEPRISWQVADGDVLSAEIRLDVLGSTKTAPIDSADRILVAWPFAPLESRTIGSLSVRSRHPAGWSEWSDPLAFETTLLDRADWSAELIRPRERGRIGDPAPVFATTFSLPDRILRARLYISAHGVFEAAVDGRRVGEDLLAPGWTSYRHRLRFLTYDVTPLLDRSSTCHRLMVTVGNGWFRGRLGWSGSRAFYGEDLGVLAQLEITDHEGRVHTVRTDESWTVGDGSVVGDDLYDGMKVDFTRAMHEGAAVDSFPGAADVLFPSETRPIRELARWRPVAVQAVGARSDDHRRGAEPHRVAVSACSRRSRSPRPDLARRGPRRRAARDRDAAQRGGQGCLCSRRSRARAGASVHLPRLPLRRDSGDRA